MFSAGPYASHDIFFVVLVLILIHKFLFYNKFIICLYMFRALCAHHQEVKIVQGYYKRNRHFQRYVVSKPLA